uniref:Uncharacterized protein n=1 Tax=Hucho hucho TaxID=62062 RepID=A0A4W5QWU3_9TELE
MPYGSKLYMCVSSLGLLANISHVTDRMALLKEKLCNTSRLIPEHGALLHSLPNGTSEQVLDAKEQTALANASLQRALERLEELRVRLEESSTAVAHAKTSISNTNQLFSDSQSTGETNTSFRHPTMVLARL